MCVIVIQRLGLLKWQDGEVVMIPNGVIEV